MAHSPPGGSPSARRPAAYRASRLTAAATEPAGRAYLVGVGPGDPELLTLRAFRLLATADLVLYDRLIPGDILRCARPGAELLYCGKTQGLHSRSQEEIHMLLWHYARRGKTVVRLKGGDPTVFGRGGEELEYLEKRGVAVEVVPGITAACGVAASLGVPLTHRDYADSVQFVTGHRKAPGPAPAPVAGQEPAPALDLDWERLARPRTTLVVYMGLQTLPELALGLERAGLGGDTPACAVQEGTTPRQRVVRAPLAALPAAVAAADLASPTLIFIGEVVGLLTDERVAQAADEAVRRQALRPGQAPAIFDFVPRAPGGGAAARGEGSVPVSEGWAVEPIVTAPPRQ